MYPSIDSIIKMTKNIKVLWKPESDIWYICPFKNSYTSHTHIMKVKHDWLLTFSHFS